MEKNCNTKKTWIKPLEIIKIKDNIIFLKYCNNSVETITGIEYINKKYKAEIETFIKKSINHKYKIEIIE